MADCGYSELTQTSFKLHIWNLAVNAYEYDQFGLSYTHSGYYDDFAGWTQGTSGTSFTKTFYNLNPNTYYELDVNAKYRGAWYKIGTISFNTLEQNNPPSTPSSGVRIASRIEGGFDLAWGTSDKATGYVIAYKYQYDSYWSESYVSGTSYRLSNRSYGVIHDFKVKASNDYGDSDYTSVTSATTSPKTPTLTFVSSTNTSATVKVSGMTENWDAVDVTLGSTTLSVANNNQTVTFTGLTRNQTYTVSGKSRFYIHGTTLYSVNTAYINVNTKTRPSYFSWDTDKISGQPFNMKATEWNRLIQNVKDMHVYTKGGYDSYTYPLTNVSSGGIFYASRFNEVRKAIGSMASTGIYDKYKGDKIYANELNILRDRINSIE